MSHENIPNYIKLFGEVDFRGGESARTVYSPAAYLSDLLQLIDDELTSPDSTDENYDKRFDQRRSDIRSILLNKENTFDLLPYLNIVNERLEDKIEADSGSDAYTTLRRASYPLDLPFDLENERYKLYLKYLSIPPVDFYKLFSSEKYDRREVAREYLGLNSKDQVLIVKSIEGNELEKRFGGKLGKLDGRRSVNVKAFVEALDISHLELRELLHQNLSDEELEAHRQRKFYVNANLGGYVDFSENESKLVWRPNKSDSGKEIPEAWFDRCLRFVFLSKRVSLAYADLDLILRKCCRSTINHQALLRIAVAKFVQSKFELSADEVCALFAPLNNSGYGSNDLPEDLFNRAFNNNCAEIEESYIGKNRVLPSQYQGFKQLVLKGDIRSERNKDYRRRIARGLGISSERLLILIAGFSARRNEVLNDKERYDRLWSRPGTEKKMLAALYRAVKLTEVLDISIEELFMLLDVIERDPYVRKTSNEGVLIDFSIKPRNCYAIIRAGVPGQMMWLTQVLAGLVDWMRKMDFSAEELLRISSGLFPRELEKKVASDNHFVAVNSSLQNDENARKEKVEALNNVYQNVKPELLNKLSYESSAFDARSSRIIYETVSTKASLVLEGEPRLAKYDDKAIRKAAIESIYRFDTIQRDDFLDLGIEQKVADKIFNNLVLRGYLTSEGVLNEENIPQQATEFEVETDFSAFKQKIFNTTAELHKEFVDTAIYPSDLETLELDNNALEELHDNLKFNGYLSDEGTLLEPRAFESSDYIDFFEVNSGIGEYSDHIYTSISENIAKFNKTKIKVSKDIFSDLPLSETELEELVDNLRFNDYIDNDDVLLDNKALLDIDANSLLLALKFYPHRHEILSRIQTHIRQHRSRFYTLKKADFNEVAVNLIADWVYTVLERQFLSNGRLSGEKLDYFNNPENIANFDIAWPFEPHDNQVVFKRIHALIQAANRYQFIHLPLEALYFNRSEISGLMNQLQTKGFISSDRKIFAEKIEYFLHIDNALDFRIDGFEDYNKDIFFILHDIAKRVNLAVEEISLRHAAIVERQEGRAFESLQELLGVDSDSIKALSEQIFEGAENVRDEWLLPILKSLDTNEKLNSEPASSRFNSAFRRIVQFAQLAKKLNLSAAEIGLVFADQNLFEKFSEDIELPQIKYSDGKSKTISHFDALLESKDGKIYLFKSADPENNKDYARYWVYSSVTHERFETHDDKLSSLLMGEEGRAKKFRDVVAAFVDKLGRDVLIVDQKYYVRERNEHKGNASNGDALQSHHNSGEVQAKEVWKAVEREWGLTDSQFDEVSVVDAAYSDGSGRSYLFANDQYIRYSGNVDFIDDGYPKRIKEDWENEAQHKSLPAPFACKVNAAFYGKDNKSYFFNGESFVSSEKPNEVKETREFWGKVKNNLQAGCQVDAAYTHNANLFVLSGDQIFSFRDSVENSGLAIREGFPRSIQRHFRKALPERFFHGADAVFNGEDGLLHFFKGEDYAAIDANSFRDDNTVPSNVVKITRRWGKVRNSLLETSKVDAAFTGLDGRVYIFSGAQYFRYSSADYSIADPGFPRSIREDWEGLRKVHAAFVLDGKTYIFGTRAPDKDDSDKTPQTQNINKKLVYVRYSTKDYDEVDEGYPKLQNETDDIWWNLPDAIKEQHNFKKVDAVFNAPDGRTYLFSKDVFVYFDQAHRWWSEPAKITQRWDNIPFESISAAFSGKDGKTYLFSSEEYIRYSNAEYNKVDNGYPRPINKLWGNIKNNIQECGRIDAALVLESTEREILEDDALVPNPREDDGPVKIRKIRHTYLFCGDQFYRYKGDNYDYVEVGYPKLLSELNDEPRFKNLSSDVLAKLQSDKSELNEGEPIFIDAGFADQRNVYLLKGKDIHVVSEHSYAEYKDKEGKEFRSFDCAVIENGGLYVEKNGKWHHKSNPEAEHSKLKLEHPALFSYMPKTYQSGLSAILQGVDGNTYLFKGKNTFNVQLKRSYAIADKWARVSNKLQDQNRIDAAFVGRDGKTYVFSDDQYVIYEGSDYIGEEVYTDVKNASGIRSIKADWAGLKNVHCAYVVGDETYVFEKPDYNGNFRYLRFSGSDYSQPDTSYPRSTDVGFWSIPSEYLEQGWANFDALVVDNAKLKDVHSLIFIRGTEFLQYSIDNQYWFDPAPLDQLFLGIDCSDDLLRSLQSVLLDDKGGAYFFGEHCYLKIKNRNRSEEKKISRDWGILPNTFSEGVDAAVVLKDKYTYLFSGNKYVRYSTENYALVDKGYPKYLSKDLRHEPGFENLPPSFEVHAELRNKNQSKTIVQAVIANDRSVYIYMGGNCYVSSETVLARFPIHQLSHKPNNIVQNGKIDAAFSYEGRSYLFSGDQYIRYSGEKYHFIDEGYPKRIATALAREIGSSNIPEECYAGIDAALVGKIDEGDADAGRVFLFRREKFFDSKEGTFKRIKGQWAKIQNNFTPEKNGVPAIDAAFVDGEGRLYAFKGDQIIRYTDTEKKCVEVGYPQKIASTFKQLPRAYEKGVEGAFTFAGRTYLVNKKHKENKKENKKESAVEYVRYPDDDFGSRHEWRLKNIYPLKFNERWAKSDWGKQADYSLRDIHIISRFKALQNNYGDEKVLAEIFGSGRISTTDASSTPYETLANIFSWDIDDLKWLKRQNAFLPPQVDEEQVFHLELILRIADIFELCGKMGSGVAQTYSDVWKKRFGSESGGALGSNKKAADYLYSLLGIQYCGGKDWDILANEAHAKLNALKRNALVSYCIHNDEDVEDRRDLYEKLLIDVQMSEEVETSRIKEAISALQLYWHRFFINLEPAKLSSEELSNEDISHSGHSDSTNELLGSERKKRFRARWEWMRNYRVWEANRKVFLHPENYIRPELRDTKSPEFIALEEQLLQGELTDANIARVFNRYIDHYAEISRLTIAGGYVYDNYATDIKGVAIATASSDKNVVLFGRTKSEPRRYYYRTARFVGGRSDSVNWQPWEEVNVLIDSDRVYPVFAFNKVFVFWAVVEVRNTSGPSTKIKLKENEGAYESESDYITESVLQVYYSYFNLNKEWSTPQKLNYSITSNDTITSYFLDFSGAREEANENLDNIKVRCHYTTERQVKPETDSDDKVTFKALEKALGIAQEQDDSDSEKSKLDSKESKLGSKKNKKDDDEVELYLRAANDSEAHYIEKGDDDFAFAGRVVPGDSVTDGMKFRAVKALEGDKDMVSFESLDDDDHYLCHDDHRSMVRKEKSSKSFEESASFFVVKSTIGDGYSFIPSDLPDHIMHYNQDRELWVKPWNDLNTHAEKRQATFSFFIKRRDELNTFRFYPETNLVEELEEAKSTDSPPLLQSGMDTFKELFPHEDEKKISLPVLLNVPNSEKSLPWVCFDYKGGSFLCKPSRGQVNLGDRETLKNLPEGFDTISAAVHFNNTSYLFSGEHFVSAPQEQLEKNGTVLSAKTTSSVWGRVVNNIQDDNRVDTAFIIEGRIYLTRGNQYVRYSDDLDYVDYGYPRSIKNNEDQLPRWERIDAAFHIAGLTYFIRDDIFAVSSDLSKTYKVEDRLWPKEFIKGRAKEKVTAAFVKSGKVFVCAGDRYIRFSDVKLSEPDKGYPKLIRESGDDKLPKWNRIDAAFVARDNVVRYFKDSEFTTSRNLSKSESIDKVWAKIKNRIQANGRVTSALNIKGKLYLISQDQYYRYDESKPDVLEEGYPKSLKGNNEGLPSWPGLYTAFVLVDKAYCLYKWGLYVEVDLNGGKNSYGWISSDWQWPGDYKAFTTIYTVADKLYLLSRSRGRNRYLKYDKPDEEFIPRKGAKYDIVRLSSMTGTRLGQALFAGGTDALMQRTVQEIDELPTFTFDQEKKGDAIIRANPERVSGEHFPVHSHLEFRGANGSYYWELFYHAPMLIAQSLNTAQDFERAKQWYEYVFDPTEVRNYWKFLPFLAVDIEAITEVITKLEAFNETQSAARDLIKKLMPYSAALLGLKSMSESKLKEFNRLRRWDDNRKNYLTWAEVDKLSEQIKVLDESSNEAAVERLVDEGKEILEIIKRLPQRYELMRNGTDEQIQRYLDDPFDPHAIAALRPTAYRRTTVMAYIDNLIDWGDQLFRQYSRESINEARMLYVLAYDLLGKKPENIGPRALSDDANYDDLADKGADKGEPNYDFLFDVAKDKIVDRSFSHAGLVHASVGNPYYFVPENSQLLGYWERIEDRLYKIRHSMNIMGIKQPLPLFQPPVDPMVLVRGVAGGASIRSAVADLHVQVPHYHFTFLLSKARELTDKLNQMSDSLFSVLEKQDAEEIGLLQNEQEAQLLTIGLDIKKAQLKEAQENIKQLEQSKANAENQKKHYENLVSNGMIGEEEKQIELMSTAATIFALIPILKLTAAVVKALPDIKVGSPFTVGSTMGGSTIGAAIGFVASSGESFAESLSMQGEVAGIYAQHKRAVEDWELQQQSAEGEIKQLEHQIEGANWQLRAAEYEVLSSEKEIEHRRSVSRFMKKKFTNQQLYQWASSRLSSLYFQTYNLAHDMAKSAEKAYVFERGVEASEVSFINGNYWDGQKKGLLSGARLSLDLDRMENAYLQNDTRRFEISKTVSLLELDPMALLQLKEKRKCDFKLTEALFDYDFPGHYCRQLKSISVKITAGEGRTVNATLTQLSNQIVMKADTKAVKYLLEPKESQPLSIRSDWRPLQQIAVSEVDPYSEVSSGMFELDFRSEKYLPFEGTGAVSSWRLELGGKKGSYNINELENVELEIKYTALQGGEAFAESVKGMLKPYTTAVYIDMAQQFPNEFFAYVNGDTENLEINVAREMFPNISGSKISGVFSRFEMSDESQLTMVMNEDDSLHLRDNKLIPVTTLAVSARGTRWQFKAKGNRSKLQNMTLVFVYKASVI